MRSPRYCPCCVRTSPRSFIPQCSFIRSPCACSPLHAHSYSPRSPRTCSPSFVPSLVFVCTPLDSFVIPALASCSFVHRARSYRTPLVPARARSSIPGARLVLPLLLPLPLCVRPRWLPGSCAPALCLSFCLWYLTCNRIVSLPALYLPFYLDSTYL